MNYIDCHCHLNDPKLLSEIDNIINTSSSSGALALYNSGDSFSSFKIITSLQKKYQLCYSVLGIHPEFASNKEDFIKAMKYIESNYLNISAIGEIGLDYHYSKDEKTISDQKEIFILQIRLAKKYNLPIVIHSRDAALDTFNIIKNEKPTKVYFHCFSYSYEIYKELLKLNNNTKFGIGGVITFKNSKVLKEIVSLGNLDTFLSETDCPYLAPTPYRGQTNYPYYIPYIIEEIANITCKDIEQVSKILLNNAKEFYNE